MSLSVSTKELLEQARFDGPSAAAQEAMWSGIQASTAASTAASAAVAAKGLGVLSSKLVLGMALGASVALGVAGTIVALRSSTSTGHEVEAARVRETREIAPPVEMPRLPVVIRGHVAPTADPKDEITVEPAAADKTPATQATQPAQVAPAPPVLSEQDRLAREARTVSEARGALRRGEPEVALRLVRAERHKRGARMVPEELNVEIQALRATGDEVGARAAEAELAGKYPEQSLAH
ncbi:MAG TPA: hypothetical protein VLM85_22280 [Polyangiaceae bacterium]|nr:hypothetical protein [Polyangiaceae bacterium]